MPTRRTFLALLLALLPASWLAGKARAAAPAADPFAASLAIRQYLHRHYRLTEWRTCTRSSMTGSYILSHLRKTTALLEPPAGNFDPETLAQRWREIVLAFRELYPPPPGWFWAALVVEECVFGKQVVVRAAHGRIEATDGAPRRTAELAADYCRWLADKDAGGVSS